MRRRLESERVHLGWLARVSGEATPLAIVTFDEEGDPGFQVYGQGIEATMRAGASFLSEALAEADALVFGSNTLVGPPERELTMLARREAFDLGLPVLFDPNLRPNRWQRMDRAVAFCRELCDGAFVVKTSRHEAELITGSSDPRAAALGLCELGARIGVVTLGADGAVMRGASSGEVAAPEVEVVSALGAGDAFMGALAAGVAALGWDSTRAAEALPAAAQAGATACEGWGAWD
jgi:fructokinase